MVKSLELQNRREAMRRRLRNQRRHVGHRAQSLTLICRLPRRRSGLLCRHRCDLRVQHILIPTVGIIAITLDNLGRDHGHFATCNWLVQIGGETNVTDTDDPIVRR
jgi:hypothetical protein